MKYIIIGNGAAGTAAAGTIRQLDKEGEITVFSDEKQLYYARPRLPEVAAGNLAPEELIVFPLTWYEKQNIAVKLDCAVHTIDTEKKQIATDQGQFSWDRLVMAAGSDPFVPPLPGIDREGVYALRTVEDALAIQEAISDQKRVLVIGGGLLGLELAGSLTTEDREVLVLEMCGTLLPRQLAPEQGRVLQHKLEDRGFSFILDDRCSHIEQNSDGSLAVHTADGTEYHVGSVIFSAGARPRLDLPREAGLATGKGIIVDQHLAVQNCQGTPIGDMYAAGDSIELDGKLWGFTKSSMEQGRIAGENAVRGPEKIYTGTELDVKLKVRDIDLRELES